LVEHDVQDEEFELGLVRKDSSLTQNSMVENGKFLKVKQGLDLTIWKVGRKPTNQGKLC